MNWPIYFSDNLIKGNPLSNTGVCTLWLKKDSIAKSIDPGYVLIGNLYSKDGINYLIRNILANPNVRFILLCGFDRSGSGTTLLDLHKHGIDKKHVIKENGFQLQKEIPLSAINLFREKVEIINLIYKYHPSDLNQAIRQIPDNLPPCTDKPLIFPEPKIVCETYPSEERAIVVRGGRTAEVWVKLLDLILKFGLSGKTQYTVNQKEIIDIACVISEEDPDDIYCPGWLPFDKDDLTDYYAQILTDLPAPDISYTYGQKLLNFNGINQVNEIIDRLREDRYTRRALASLWDPAADSYANNPHNPPCLNLVQCRIIEDKLLLTAYFRSHDIYRAWPQNAFALRQLQKMIAKKIRDITLGDLIIISHSAHIYEYNWTDAKKIVKKQYPRLEKNVRFQRDPRGCFAIRVENRKIIVDHYAPDGKHIQTFSGATTNALSQRISGFISLMSHGISLGAELAKAEFALKAELPYIQDAEIKL